MSDLDFVVCPCVWFLCVFGHACVCVCVCVCMVVCVGVDDFLFAHIMFVTSSHTRECHLYDAGTVDASAMFASHHAATS